VFAAGSAGTIITFDGSGWSAMNSGITDELSQLKGIWGTSSSNVIAVGTFGTILHYDGMSWSPMASGTTDFLNSVWGSSADTVFAVGTNGTILRYDGAPAITTSTTSTGPFDRCPVEAIYGEYAPQTALLRACRDAVARSGPEGRQLIALYYAWSPFIVNALQADATFRQWLKEAMDGLIPLLAQAVAAAH
jgi:hypothetical protein